ncbi:MAG: hypothetical protein PQJ59_10295 [Spirochaetales bacterium]|nr:hypothetical protein [Spirochaetales bacterium]
MEKSFLNRIFLLVVFTVLTLSCTSAPAAEPLVMESLLPPVEEAVVQAPVEKNKPLPVIPLYVRGKVMEVEVVQGVQKFLYVMFNDEIIPGPIPEGDWDVSDERLVNMPRSYSLQAGMSGVIYSDTRFSEKAGDFVILEQYDDIYKARIDGLNYIIDRSSLVQIQIR